MRNCIFSFLLAAASLAAAQDFSEILLEKIAKDPRYGEGPVLADASRT